MTSRGSANYAIEINDSSSKPNINSKFTKSPRDRGKVDIQNNLISMGNIEFK